MKKTKKALASIAIAGMTLSLIPFNVFAAAPTTTRIAGVTAEQTAVKIADQTGYTGTAVLASSTSYGMVDALTAGPLAASLKAPILLTGAGNTLDAATKAELKKLEVKKVYVTSGTAVIKQGVIDELKAMGIEVEALGGYDRAETSVNIAKKMTGVTKVAIANTVPDALSIAAVASAANQAILLTDKDALPASVASYLSTAGITSSDVIGGTGVISDAVVAGLPGAERHYGMTAYDTNNQVIQDFAASLEFDNVYVANGVTGIDALAGAPLAAQTNSAIVLTDGKTVPAAAAFTHGKNATAVVTALGGEAVVPEAVRAGVAAGNVTPVTNELAIVSVSGLDATNTFLEIAFSKPVTALETSNITVQHANTLARYGVKEVKLSSNRQVATVELYAKDDNSNVLEYLQDYFVTVTVDGQTLKATFNRPYSFESRVQDINVGDKKITVFDNKTGTSKTLKVLDSDFDYQAALGELVQVWYNGDNELVNSQIITTSAKYDAIEVTKVNQIKLISEDTKYDISEETYSDGGADKFKFYLNDERQTVSDFEDLVGDKFNFAKVGFDKSGDIAYVSAYTLKDFLIFDSLDGDEVIGVEGNSGSSFDAEDATIVKGGKIISAKDLKKGDLIFFNEDADDKDGYAEVFNNVIATGEIDEVYSTSIEVDGEVYDFDYDDDGFNYERQAIYINEDGEVEDVDSDAAEELQAAGEVALYADHAGNLIYISGDVAAIESNKKYATLTENILGYSQARDKVEIEALTQDEDELSFDIDLKSLDAIIIGGEELKIDNDHASKDWTAKLNSDKDGIVLTKNGGARTESVMFDDEGNVGSIVRLHLDDNGKLKKLEFFSGTDNDTMSVEKGDKYIDGNKLTSNTILFDATDGTDADDVVVSNWGDYTGAEITNGYYITNDKQEVVAVWYNDAGDSDVVYDEAVITNVLRNTDDEVISITAYVGGVKKTIKVDKFEINLVKGDVAILEFSEKDDTLVKKIATAANDIQNVKDVWQYEERVTTKLAVDTVDVGNKKVTFTNGDTYKLADKGLVLDGIDNSDITIESLSDLRTKTNVTVVLDATGSTFAKFFVIEPAITAAADATSKVAALETAAEKDLTVKANLEAAEAAYTTANAAVTALSAGATKTALEAKVTAADITVTTARAAYDAAVEGENQDAADGVKALISALPGTGTVTVAHENQIKAARTAYTALTTVQKPLVTNLPALVTAETELAAAHVAVALKAVNDAVAATDTAAMKTALVANATVLGLDLTGYNALGLVDKNYVADELIAVGLFANADEIQEALDDILAS